MTGRTIHITRFPFRIGRQATGISTEKSECVAHKFILISTIIFKLLPLRITGQVPTIRTNTLSATGIRFRGTSSIHGCRPVVIITVFGHIKILVWTIDKGLCQTCVGAAERDILTIGKVLDMKVGGHPHLLAYAYRIIDIAIVVGYRMGDQSIHFSDGIISRSRFWFGLPVAGQGHQGCHA